MYQSDEHDTWNAIKFQPVTFILLGRKSDGATVYYTGRAGQSFVSDDRSEAFPYETLHAARRRAMNLNRMSAIHGIRFVAPANEESASASA